jgi:hypothetical protein
MNLEIVLSIAAAIIAVIGVNVGIFAWFRSDLKSFESEVRGWKDELHKESKDFHGRLVSLEERFRGK